MKKEKESKLKLFIYMMAFIATIIYIFYRIFFTIPNDGYLTIFFAILVLLVEVIDAFFFLIYVINILIYKKKNPVIPTIKEKQYPNVDVFIATVNEEKELLEETITACQNMDYPDKKKVHIYLCDDGNREEIKELAKEMNIHYITRDNNKDAKAGNYNHALNKTKSPFIATFDADMKPNNDFLMKTIPFLVQDINIGFVQYPQSFHDFDLFQKKFKLIGKIPYEQDYFYHKIQLAKNQTNSVVYCGTNTVLSRKAIRDVGGFATKTITEDIATGMLIEASGYQGIAVSDNLVYGVNVSNTESLLKQRSRWCRGCIQTLKNYKFLKNKNLTIQQKLDYLSAIYYWSFGIRTIFYLLVPLLFSFFDIRILQCNITIFLIIFFIQYFLKRFIIDMVEGHLVSSTWNRIYEMILSPIIAYESIKEILGFGNLKFEVTSKGTTIKKKFPYRSFLNYIVHLALFLFTILGMIVSYYKGVVLGFENYILPLFWLGTNLLYLGIALIFDCSNRSYVEKKQVHTNRYHFFSTSFLFFQYIRHQFRIKEILTTLFVSFLAFQVILSTFPTPMERRQYNLVKYNRYLKVKDGILVNKDNKPFQLRGVSSHNLYYFGDNYTYENLKELVTTWGINVFRVAMYTDPNSEGYIKNKNIKENVEEIIEICIDLDIYVILDWHILEDNNPSIYEEEAIAFFDEMSQKYKDVPNVLFEICNEPNGDDVTWDQDIKPYAEKVIQTIRNHSNDSIILVGTPNWSKDLESVIKNPLEDDNTMYVVHTYPEGEMNKIRLEMESAFREKIPVMVTECSATDPTGDGKLYKDIFQKWIAYLEQNHISWIVWQFSDKNETSSLLIPKELKEKEWIDKKIKTKKEIESESYSINQYISEEGKLVKDLLLKYTKKSTN